MFGCKTVPARRRTFCRMSGVILLVLATASPAGWAAAEKTDLEVALDLANLLRAARSVISLNQELINDPAIADKGLTGEVVLDAALERYKKTFGGDPRATDPQSRHGRLLRAEMTAISEVVDANQDTINRPGIDFKGFVPAVFGRLVTERFAEKAGEEAQIKVTAPIELVRNRKARPDPWEHEIIRTKLSSPKWPKNEIYSATVTMEDREAFRVLVPEYYTAGCLSCHGEPKGEIDITGYPKEGGKLGDLGGVISVTLFR